MQSLRPPHSEILVAITLLATVTFSALAVVSTSYKNRQLFIALQNLQTEETRLQIQLGRLLLEESAWSSHALVEKLAQSRLNMFVPAPEQLVIALLPAEKVNDLPRSPNRVALHASQALQFLASSTSNTENY